VNTDPSPAADNHATPPHTAGPWTVAWDPADGGRLTRLQYGETDLFTAAPPAFRPPARDYGRYELRPVYGYDDCFPTVDACDDWPDHGELCWLPWAGSVADATTRSARWPLTFTRRLTFGPRELRWSFAAANDGDVPRPVQHVMHPLFPVTTVTGLELPPGRSYDAAAVARQLLGQPRGTSTMLHLAGIEQGRCTIGFRHRRRLTISFDRALFPTLGIWWNHLGYPDEAGCRRDECSLQPTPGPTSRLGDGTTMIVPPRGQLAWEVVWEIS
jgi:hypothetical protein